MTSSPGHRVPGRSATPRSKFLCPMDGTPLRVGSKAEASDEVQCPVCGDTWKIEQLIFVGS